MAVWMNTRSGTHRFPHILLFLFLGLCPTVARADCGDSGDIPFTVTLLHPLPPNTSARCLFVHGPYFRQSSGANVRELAVGQSCTFYAAKNTILSPFGVWFFEIASECLRPLAADPIVNKRFSLEQGNVNRVDVTVDPLGGDRFNIQISTGGRTVEASEETAGQPEAAARRTPRPVSVSVNAWLGDSTDNSSGIPESDKFSFYDAEEDFLTIRLEADPRSGNNGGFATLRLQTDFGAPVNQVTGKLPQTITFFQVNQDLRYDIVVEQPTGGRGDADYIGGYILRVESALGTIGILTPGRSVEK